MIEFLFSQYKNYSPTEIGLEITAVLFGLTSVWYAKKNNVLVFPTGIVNTAIYVYLLYHWNLLGDMMINGYYVIMSVYGWINWSKNSTQPELPITIMHRKEKQTAVVVFFLTITFVAFIYFIFNKFTHYTTYIDTFVTGIFFVGMWLMTKRKIENWIFWILGDIISVPMYFIKGYTFTSMQYLLFTIIAILGYREWNKILHKTI